MGGKGSPQPKRRLSFPCTPANPQNLPAGGGRPARRGPPPPPSRRLREPPGGAARPHPRPDYLVFLGWPELPVPDPRCDPDLMKAYEVSRAVNSVKNDTPECVEPVHRQTQGRLEPLCRPTTGDMITSRRMESLRARLEQHGLAKYTELFAENGIDLDVLAELTDADLKDLQVPLGDRRRILKAAAAIVHASADPLSSRGSRG